MSAFTGLVRPSLLVPSLTSPDNVVTWANQMGHVVRTLSQATGPGGDLPPAIWHQFIFTAADLAVGASGHTGALIPIIGDPGNDVVVLMFVLIKHTQQFNPSSGTYTVVPYIYENSPYGSLIVSVAPSATPFIGWLPLVMDEWYVDTLFFTGPKVLQIAANTSAVDVSTVTQGVLEVWVLYNTVVF